MPDNCICCDRVIVDNIPDRSCYRTYLITVPVCAVCAKQALTEQWAWPVTGRLSQVTYRDDGSVFSTGDMGQ